MRLAPRSTLLAVCLTLPCAPDPARAQACHDAPPPPPGITAAPPALAGTAAAPTAPARPRRRIGLRLSLGLHAAAYRTARYEGTYQALALAASYRHRRFGIDGALAGYRLARNGAVGYGPGDLLLGVEVPLLRREGRSGSLALGAYAAATLPTGDAAADVGMGHVMLMPSLFLSARRGAIAAHLALGYGAALGARGGHRHASGPTPLVDPMNPYEWEGALSGSYDAAPWLQLFARARGALAAPLPGEGRLIIGTGARVLAGGLEISIEGQAAPVGRPFNARGALTLAYNL